MQPLPTMFLAAKSRLSNSWLVEDHDSTDRYPSSEASATTEPVRGLLYLEFLRERRPTHAGPVDLADETAASSTSSIINVVEDPLGRERGQNVDDEWNPAEEFKQLCRTRWETCGGTDTLGSWRRYWEQSVQEVAAAVASPVEPAVVPGTSPAEAIASLTDTDLKKLKNAIDEEWFLRERRSRQRSTPAGSCEQPAAYPGNGS